MELSSSTLVAAEVSMGGLFKMDGVTRSVSVETCVVVTTLLLVARFLVDFIGPWYAAWSVMAFAVPALETLNFSMVHYTMGLMQLSAGTVNDYFQVWAVLLVTLQYSVKVGRPYSRSKQIPLLDLMSSVWAANLLRVQATHPLKFPLWLMWTLNAARIISYFASTDKAVAINQKNLRLTADYMSYEHKLGRSESAANPCTCDQKGLTMDEYKYLILGEDQVLKNLHESKSPPPMQAQQEHSERRKYRIHLDPVLQEKLITVDKIWNLDGGKSGLLGTMADQRNQLKDACLSFALYKLLRRQFYDLPVHEARLPKQREKIRRLVFEYILHDAERAFRVVATEISFLQDLFYSKHAATFANGFPATNLVLSLFLIAATAYVAYPVRYISERMNQSDHNRITHGVFITRLIVALIVGKELAEIYLYVFSQWTKVLMLCSYVKHQCLQHAVMETAMRMLLFFITRDKWNEQIRQYNILISTRPVKVPRFLGTKIWNKFPTSTKMEECTKDAVFQYIKRLEHDPDGLSSYFSKAFGAREEDIHKKLLWAFKHEADTHRILVWHIATGLCEIKLASNKADALRPCMIQPRPFIEKPNPSERWWEHYVTASSLSNYCAYLVMLALVPDNGLVTLNVLNEVRREIARIITMGGCIRPLLKLRSMQDVHDCLMETVNKSHQQAWAQGYPDEEAPMKLPKETKRKGHPLGIENSLTSKGATLANQLMEECTDDNYEGLWEKLATFWTGYLLHLAASTRASKHRMRLAGRRELTTHLWALLSHAGYVRSVGDGQEAMDPVDRAAFDFAHRI